MKLTGFLVLIPCSIVSLVGCSAVVVENSSGGTVAALKIIEPARPRRRQLQQQQRERAPHHLPFMIPPVRSLIMSHRIPGRRLRGREADAGFGA